MVSGVGEDARLLGGGQSLIPLMKLRFANPLHLIDLNFIGGASFIREEKGGFHFGALPRHAEIEKSAVAAKIPILRDCAAGIADVQVTNRGTIGRGPAQREPTGELAAGVVSLMSEREC